MLRVIHNQTVTGAILVDDIDDGLPNKTARRLGGTADPKAYERDGYANARKQPCYVKRVSTADPTVAGYIDVEETARVLLSSEKGKIAGFRAAGLVTLVSFVAADVAAPTVASAVLGGTLVITGTNLTSLAPNITRVVITGTGATTLTQSQITLGGGVVGALSITIPLAMIPGVAIATSSVAVTADLQTSTPAVAVTLEGALENARRSHSG